MDPSQDAFLLRWIPPQKPICACLYLLWSGAPFLFGPQEGFLACADREVFPDLRSGFTPLDQHQVSGLEAHCLLPQKAPPRVLTWVFERMGLHLLRWEVLRGVSLHWLRELWLGYLNLRCSLDFQMEMSCLKLDLKVSVLVWKYVFGHH